MNEDPSLESGASGIPERTDRPEGQGRVSHDGELRAAPSPQRSPSVSLFAQLFADRLHCYPHPHDKHDRDRAGRVAPSERSSRPPFPRPSKGEHRTDHPPTPSTSSVPLHIRSVGRWTVQRSRTPVKSVSCAIPTIAAAAPFFGSSARPSYPHPPRSPPGRSATNSNSCANSLPFLLEMAQPSTKKQSMAEIKLRRLTELNTRLREDLDRPRVQASEACESLIAYTKATKDYMVPSIWGQVGKGEDRM